jgi:hypothetical protein
MEEQVIPTMHHVNTFPVILLLVLLAFIVCANMSIAINLYKYSKSYKGNKGHYLLFLHPILMIPLGLLFGIFASILVSLLNAMESRTQH